MQRNTWLSFNCIPNFNQYLVSMDLVEYVNVTNVSEQAQATSCASLFFTLNPLNNWILNDNSQRTVTWYTSTRNNYSNAKQPRSFGSVKPQLNKQAFFANKNLRQVLFFFLSFYQNHSGIFFYSQVNFQL